jgi:hypothetical protein
MTIDSSRTTQTKVTAAKIFILSVLYEVNVAECPHAAGLLRGTIRLQLRSM